jgi:hypothetical protein
MTAYLHHYIIRSQDKSANAVSANLNTGSTTSEIPSGLSTALADRTDSSANTEPVNFVSAGGLDEAGNNATPSSGGAAGTDNLVGAAGISSAATAAGSVTAVSPEPDTTLPGTSSGVLLTIADIESISLDDVVLHIGGQTDKKVECRFIIDTVTALRTASRSLEWQNLLKHWVLHEIQLGFPTASVITRNYSCFSH